MTRDCRVTAGGRGESMPGRPRRVPPPPPPGFGDEEYYRLYGEHGDEQYQKYRSDKVIIWTWMPESC